VDFAEALRVLGLDDADGELTKERIRRTYLRKLKEHPPERDPDGFVRLREAYELLRDVAGEERPALRFVLVPVPVPVEPEPEPDLPELPEPPPPPPSLDDRTATVLRMLQHGELDAASELAAAWRETDDHRQSSHAIVRWALARELLGVAPIVPSLVVRELARGIATGSMTGPKQVLATFHAERPFDAEEANVVLARRASSLHRMVGDALVRKAAAFNAPTRRGGGSNVRLVWVGAVIALGIIRILSSAITSSSSPTHYPPPQPQIDPSVFKNLPDPLPLPEPPPPFREDQPATVQRDEMRASARALIALGNDGALRDEAIQLSRAIASGDCGAIRLGLQRISKLPVSPNERRAQSNADHFVALAQRVEIVCPPV
jgi:hypothetical protein